MIGTLDLRHPPRIAPESARTLDQPSAANPPASQASAPWWSGQSGGRSQNGVDRPVADRGVSDVIWPTGRVAGGGTWFGGRTPCHRRLRRMVCFAARLPFLWLDVPTLIRGDLAAVQAVLRPGLNSPGHAEFVARLERDLLA